METGELQYLEAERAALPEEYGNSGKKNKKKKVHVSSGRAEKAPGFLNLGSRHFIFSF